MQHIFMFLESYKNFYICIYFFLIITLQFQIICLILLWCFSVDFYLSNAVEQYVGQKALYYNWVTNYYFLLVFSELVLQIFQLNSL